MLFYSCFLFNFIVKALLFLLSSSLYSSIPSDFLLHSFTSLSYSIPICCSYLELQMALMTKSSLRLFKIGFLLLNFQVLFILHVLHCSLFPSVLSLLCTGSYCPYPAESDSIPYSTFHPAPTPIQSSIHHLLLMLTTEQVSNKISYIHRAQVQSQALNFLSSVTLISYYEPQINCF